ncbi:hypothetical protein [Halobacteriovorax sp. HLS]|uniref:hypothetical protein n=1 Tax=Halobacteriovorax sp. HLS TaxID=2234000 RepID=UPI000FD8DF2F|nr:hypothetical protein [Halobacteriovorax sp. HLS]
MKALIFSIFIAISIFSTHADEFEDKKIACREDAARTWSLQLNRCILKTEFKDSLKNYRSCTNLETKELRDDCMFKLAKEVSGDASLDDFDDNNELILNSLSFLLSGVNMWYVGTSKKYTSCTSLKLSSLCGAAAVVKNFVIRSKGRKATNSIKDDFLSRAKDQENFDTQVIAYQAQIDQLNNIAKFYEMKEKAHKITAACYMATVAVAVTEATYGQMSCVDQTHDGEGEELDKETMGSGQKGFDGFMKNFDGAAASIPYVGAMMKFTSTPWGIAAINTVNFGYQIKLADVSGEEADKAKLLAEKIDVAKNQFVDGMGQYCPKGHDDKSDLTCYCYEDGKKKSNRTNSAKCKALWNSNDRQLYAKSRDKQRGSPVKERIGCIKVNGQFDPNCECRKFKDQQGNNACRKANFSTVNLGGFDKMLDIKKLEEDMNNITSGIDAPGKLNLSSNQLTAIGDAVKKQVISKLKVTDKNGKQRPMTLEDFKKVEGNLSKQAQSIAASGGPKSDIGSPLAEAEKSLQEIIAKSPNKVDGLVMEGGKGMGKKKKKKSDDFNVSFNMDNSGGSNVQTFKGGDYMDKTYNTGDADINNKKEESIFRILTNRYNKSGYRRLFKD